MSYSLHDFKECITHQDIGGMLPSPALRVIKAYGEDDGDWRGGFVLELQNGQYAYNTGWCDYTGWG